MKLRILILILTFGYILPSQATDTLFVREPQIPILIDRTDNILYEMRISADKGEILNRLTLRFAPQTETKNIRAIRLFYAGVEAPSRTGNHFCPTYYLSRDTPHWTRKAIESYSVLQDEVSKPKNQVELTSSQPMLAGVNYFWISIEVDKKTPLTSKLSVEIADARINNRPAIIAGPSDAGIRRVGIGVRHAGDDGVAAYRIPGLVTTRKGTLLGVYDVRYNSSVDLQEKVDIGVSRSTDGGQHWEPMRIAMTFGQTGGLPHAQNGVGDPSILVDEQTGTIWIIAAWTHGMGNGRAWFNSMPGMKPEETAQLMLVRSDDDGRSWSKPINITSQVKDPSWYFLLQGPGRGITMQDGTLVFPIQFIDSKRLPHAGIMYSKDHGKTWHIHTPARSDTTEAQVVEIERGVLMLNMRDNRGGSRAVSITRDLGRTWEEHVSNRSALREPVCMASLLHVPASENVLGRDLLLFSNPDTTKGRNHITIKASLDGGKSWPKAYQIMIDEEDSWGYSCLSMIDSKTLGIFYEASVAHMTFQAIPLRDLIPE